jgi:hypothetical protein
MSTRISCCTCTRPTCAPASTPPRSRAQCAPRQVGRRAGLRLLPRVCARAQEAQAVAAQADAAAPPHSPQPQDRLSRRVSRRCARRAQVLRAGVRRRRRVARRARCARARASAGQRRAVARRRAGGETLSDIVAKEALRDDEAAAIALLAAVFVARCHLASGRADLAALAVRKEAAAIRATPLPPNREFIGWSRLAALHIVFTDLLEQFEAAPPATRSRRSTCATRRSTTAPRRVSPSRGAASRSRRSSRRRCSPPTSRTRACAR